MRPILAACLIALCAVPAHADNCFKIASKRLEAGDSLRVTLVDGSRLAGYYSAYSDSYLFLDERVEADSLVTRSIPFESLTDMRYRDKARPAVFYALAGFVAGAAIAAAAHHPKPSGGEFNFPDLGHVAIVTAGGLVGAAIAVHIPFGVSYNAIAKCE